MTRLSSRIYGVVGGVRGAPGMASVSTVDDMVKIAVVMLIFAVSVRWVLVRLRW